MNDTQKQTLLSIAKAHITAAVNEKKIPFPKSDDPELNQNRGCFVTIKNNDQLRGCIGRFTADKPLTHTVANMAISAAKDDPRFLNDPITPDELNSLDIEISVLSALKRTDDPASLRPGTDGIYIVKGHLSGCFLPQVATETGWDAQQFLSYCCAHKAGLPYDAWKDPDTEVYLFTCDVFSKPYTKIN